MTAKAGKIYVGIGGWTYEPWRGVFYPKGLPHARELSYAAEHLTSIEVNGTFYSTQSPKTFRKWASEVPDGFVFALKGPRYAVNRRVLKDAGDSIKRFIESGVTELGDRLGPLLWQFAPHKKFDEADFGGFLELLPKTFDGRSAPPCDRGAQRQLQDAGVHRVGCASSNAAVVYAEHATYTEHRRHHDDFVYARLQKGDEKLKAGYPPKALDAGPGALRSGRRAANHRAYRASTRWRRKKCRATRSSISSTRPNCARRQQLWH